ncbi:MAG: F0F1 ATP synthase subunit A [Treponema sp.]|jgi:F-type H+-transporting ATPase subunit a|nr:F0F1 ATP synthase subunit A [Treponema sp.]
MEALDIHVVFTLDLWGYKLPITETVIVSWMAMAILIIGSLLLTRNLKRIPRGAQAILETAVELLNNFAQAQFGSLAKRLGPYIGTLFLFLLTANLMGVISPIEIHAFGRAFTPPFPIRPPTRDINVTASLAALSIVLVVICGLKARGLKGWLKNFLRPLPMMLPFNIMEYGTRLISLALRLFGNILGGYVLMHLIEGLIPLGVPMIMALYFDFFDGLVQAGIFVFLTSLYISEAVKVHTE